MPGGRRGTRYHRPDQHISMRNKHLLRFQLLLLVTIGGLVIWRGQRGPAQPGGVVDLSDMKEGRLYRSGLVVDRSTEAVVSLTATYETDAEDAELATYGWILDNRSREVVWTIDLSKMERDGVLTVGADTIHLDPGSYEVFYTTLGPNEQSSRDAPFLGLTPYWTNYKSNWHMSIAEVITGTGSRALIAGDSQSAEKRMFEGGLWATGPVRSRAYHTFLFRVNRAAPMQIYAVGQMCPTGCDYGWIDDTRSGQKVWEMEWDNTTPAGGYESNREFTGTVDLSPGIYRAVYRSNGSHSAYSWEANPPFDPDGWGLTLFGISDTNISEFDPWIHAKPVISITQVGDDEHLMRQFQVNRAMSLLIYTVGEITPRDGLYDYAWLEDNDSGETIWKMSRENSLPAGGDGINRAETAFIDAEPGTYTIHFKTDGGHSYDGWLRTKPSFPDRWGVTVFPVGNNPIAEGDIVVLPSGNTTQGSDAIFSKGTNVSELGEPIVAMVQVGNDADLFYSFNLESESTLYIIAQGELSTSGSWDYGWIESDESSERVWEMTLRNTVEAGGDDRNRRFEGPVTLPAGSYTARFISDFSHAFNDFGDDKPNNPDEWGMRIFHVSQ